MIRYNENIDILFFISIYRIDQIFQYIAIFKNIIVIFFYRFFSTLRDWKVRLQMGRVNGVEFNYRHNRIIAEDTFLLSK